MQGPKRSVAAGFEQQRVQQLEQINQGLEERIRTLESSRRPPALAGSVPTAFSQVGTVAWHVEETPQASGRIAASTCQHLPNTCVSAHSSSRRSNKGVVLTFRWLRTKH